MKTKAQSYQVLSPKQSKFTRSSNKALNPYLNLEELKLERNASKKFKARVFSYEEMEKRLPKIIYKNIKESIEGKKELNPDYAETIAEIMKEWAISMGATHYSHWFQPLTGASAEKHDSFIDWAAPGKIIEKFSGNQLIQGEPDASSFPSGGLRSTYEARGYTGWDPSSPPFIWEGGDGYTLFIPSVFFSWKGDILDSKIPLLRSDRYINEACMRLLKILNLKAEQVFSTVGLEQEYFLIDRNLHDMRPDLLVLGKTVFGSPSPKGQELQDHYFASVKDRILAFMHDFEMKALELGIPVKTRHNEVAPAQHEVACVFEKASLSIDHNIILMQLMKKTAIEHDLVCLLHEKPFQGLNGSGKHCNWSLMTDNNLNLLDPSKTPEDKYHFLILITAILNAVYEHSKLLLASIGSISNDQRLGGNEAPPAIISIYLGDEIENFLNNIEKIGIHKSSLEIMNYDFGLLSISNLSKDNTDRNRTSPLAFTGNKFEFRALGSSANPSFAVTCLNTIVADSLNKILNEIESSKEESLPKAILKVVRKYLKHSKGIRYSKDSYSDEWKQEAKSRNLVNTPNSLDAFEALKEEKTVSVFKNILTKSELEGRYLIHVENYENLLNIEVNLMYEMFHTQILPSIIQYQNELANSIIMTSQVLKETRPLHQSKLLEKITKLTDMTIYLFEELSIARDKSHPIKGLLLKIKEIRDHVDQLEQLTDWPIPKYRDLLFLI